MLNDYIPFRGVVVYIWMLLMTVLAIPYVIAGAGLMRLKPWARPFGMILSTFGLLNVPLGTALGIYGLWVLMSEEADAVFSPRFDHKRCDSQDFILPLGISDRLATVRLRDIRHSPVTGTSEAKASKV